MIFRSVGQTLYREVGRLLRVSLEMILVDVKPNDIEKMSEAMAALEKVLGDSFEIVVAKDTKDTKGIENA